jgi:hypothetical protein
MHKTIKSANVPRLEETSLDGDLQAAKLRLLRFAELAASELGARQLNAISVTISAHLMGKLGPQAVDLYDQITLDLESERAKDWTIRLKNTQWGSA